MYVHEGNIGTQGAAGSSEASYTCKHWSFLCQSHVSSDGGQCRRDES